ncbi:MAG: hypothetical protein ACYTET_03455 [Planctomycetota bacterium]
MKGLLYGVLVLAACLSLAGCQPSVAQDDVLLIDFEEGVPVTYKMVAERKTKIDLTSGDPKKKSKPQTMTEKLELVMVYTPTQVDPFGETVIEAKCDSAKVTRSSFTGKRNAKDAMETLAGETFTLKLSPTGEIVDYTELEELCFELGKASFSKDPSRRIKNPDMISDFLAMQWFLWDSTSTMTDPLNLNVGKTWKTKQLLPWPVPLMAARGRVTTYTLDSFQEPATENDHRKAVIKSTYGLSEEPMENFIRPYEGSFQMRGLFGFLRNYHFKSMQGQGTQIFNMDKGLIESDRQEYTLNVDAAFMLPLGDSKPVLTVNQTMTIDQIKTSKTSD